MKVIGAGFGRTGTMSMQAALQTLGYPCYHMKEVPQRPGHLKAWDDFINGRAEMDWKTLFENYEATVDFPACAYYEEILREFPDAKVVLNVRDPEKWFNSFMTLQSTIDQFRIFRFIPKANRFIGFTDELIRQVFNGSLEKENCIEVFNRHNAAVQQNVPADRLLVFQVQEGWEPLCKFLGCEVPTDTPFPHLNEGRETIAALARQKLIGPFLQTAGLTAAAVALVALGLWLVL